MLKTEILEKVQKEFGTLFLQFIVAAVTINLTTKPKNEDFATPGAFTKRLFKKLRKQYPIDQEMASTVFDICLNLVNYQDVEDGFGGYKKETAWKVICEDIEKIKKSAPNVFSQPKNVNAIEELTAAELAAKGSEMIGRLVVCEVSQVDPNTTRPVKIDQADIWIKHSTVLCLLPENFDIEV